MDSLLGSLRFVGDGNGLDQRLRFVLKHLDRIGFFSLAEKDFREIDLGTDKFQWHSPFFG